MSFNSFEFIIFFIIVLFLYFVLPKKIVWIMLLVSSYYFYMSWNAKYAVLILFTTVITYITGILIGRENEKKQSDILIKKRKRLWVVIGILCSLFVLVFFKYYNFFMENIMAAFEKANIFINIPLSPYLLPVGISFYTFQAISYVIDVYRNDIKPEKHFGYYALFVSFFPQLVAGPIEKSKNLLPQLRHKHRFDYNRFKQGTLLIVFGLIKKIVIADRLAVLVNNVYNSPTEHTGIILIVATVFFAFQIYCDFSAYSDIAIGCSRIMGYKLMTNFNKPYSANSISDFWRRWHISLSTWFKEYLYIPLGGNRVDNWRVYINLVIVFLVSGFWHGASWTFIIWGALHGIYQIVGKITKSFRNWIYKKLNINTEAIGFNFIRILFVFALVCFAWVFFRANSVQDAFYISTNMFNIDISVITNGTLFQLGLDNSNFKLSAILIILLVFFDYISSKYSICEFLSNENIVTRWFVYISAIFIIIVFGYYGGFDESQFIYFQF